MKRSRKELLESERLFEREGKANGASGRAQKRLEAKASNNMRRSEGFIAKYPINHIMTGRSVRKQK